MRRRDALAGLLGLVGCTSASGGPSLAVRPPDSSNAGSIAPFAARTFAGLATHMATNAAGESVVVGTFDGSIDYGLGEHVASGPGDIFVVKVDPSGAPIWHTTVGGEAADQPRAVTLDDDGAITVLATHDGYSSILSDSVDARYTFLVRLDAQGQVREQHPLATVGPNAIARWTDGYAASMVGNGNVGATFSVTWLGPDGMRTSDTGIAADRGVVRALATRGDTLAVVGNYGGTMRVGGTTLPVGRDTGFVATLAQAGALHWSRVWRGATVRAAGFAKDGVLVVGGACAAGCAVPSDPDDDVDGPFVAALDATGHVLWSRRFPGRFGDGAVSSRATVTSVTIAPDGTVHAVGPFDGRLDLGDRALDALASTSVFHVALASDGHTVWSGRYPTRSVYAPPVATTDAAGHVFVAAGFRGSLDLHTAARHASDTEAGWFFARVTD